jgi:hypothetical protein
VKHTMFSMPLYAKAQPGDIESTISYLFRCSRFIRRPRIQEARWMQVMDATRAAGRGDFDVSYLD